MFAVIGQCRMDPKLDDEQHSGLQRIVAGVGQLPGLVAGYWTGAAGGATSHTFIVFDDRAFAEQFASDVRGNAQNQRRPGVENLSLDCSYEDTCQRICEGATEVYNLAADMGGMGFIERYRVECLRSVLINTHMIEAAYKAAMRRPSVPAPTMVTGRSSTSSGSM